MIRHYVISTHRSFKVSVGVTVTYLVLQAMISYESHKITLDLKLVSLCFDILDLVVVLFHDMHARPFLQHV